MKKQYSALLLLALCGLAGVFAQEVAPSGAPPPKFALVIGNGNYTGLSRLANPANDANDVAAALTELGFTVDTVLNGSLERMENAVTLLRERLSASADAYGFLFYAGHGVQSGGENYLIPVDANIPSESYLRNRALSVQVILDDLNEAGNSLNVVVLDACRDNPFGWGRGGAGRGLAMVTRQPAGSIIVYATSAGQQAADGEGRNGLFTGQLLNNLKDPSLEVKEVFNRTGADVSGASGNRQIPAVYSQFFGTAYLGGGGAAAVRPKPQPFPAPGKSGSGGAAGGTVGKAARLWTLGVSTGTAFAAPWFIGTARGTLAPFSNSFLEIGFDAGLLSGVAGAGYYSLYPYAHYAFFMPFAKRGGWYIGAGGGFMYAEYDFDGRKAGTGYFAAGAVAGVNILDMFDVSYTLRTNFKGASNKVSVGYVYRFK